MDFSVPQKGNTRFMYVLPISATEALVEYTLFSEHLLEKTAYEEAKRIAGHGDAPKFCFFDSVVGVVVLFFDIG